MIWKKCYDKPGIKFQGPNAAYCSNKLAVINKYVLITEVHTFQNHVQ